MYDLKLFEIFQKPIVLFFVAIYYNFHEIWYYKLFIFVNLLPPLVIDIALLLLKYLFKMQLIVHFAISLDLLTKDNEYLLKVLQFLFYSFTHQFYDTLFMWKWCDCCLLGYCVHSCYHHPYINKIILYKLFDFDLSIFEFEVSFCIWSKNPVIKKHIAIAKSY
jgi:hypothetical protein